MAKIVVTGINGFVGFHLAQLLSSKGYDVIGIGIEAKMNANLTPFVSEYYVVDLVQNYPELPDVDGLIHLAGFSAVGPSYDNPQRYINGNTAMVTNIGEYYAKQAKKPRIVMISSGAIYDGEQPMPISETSEIGFGSPYAVSKVAVENQARYYNKRGLNIVVARPFNHIGPGQGKGFLLPDLYGRISELAAHEHEISVGNLATARDYTDVRDIVKAYVMLLEKPDMQHLVYNISSNISIKGTQILQTVLDALGRQDVQYQIDPTLVRPTDILQIQGSHQRLTGETGWEPSYDLATTINDFITYARQEVK
ncbi:MAG: GDP-mannose 4,6-dehydratase [Lactobacillaceae bacterium]|jgi:GDP-4-dehydro-6-deoxy-D-mannose reductase|nr:GDP-mannose 4,6-dehydratase [Lactobacillaceae bacterium]